MFSFPLYVTTETTPNRQTPYRDIHNPISVDHGSNAILVLLQLAFQPIQRAKSKLPEIETNILKWKIFQHWPQQEIQLQEKTQSSSRSCL